MAMNKRKTTTAIVAGVTAVALVLGGTFAWTSISQQAKNESAGIVNVGGRLHDDFNGENKDVYVENFTDPLNGGQPIYARIKLTEYMEVGQDAGGVDDGDGITEAVPVIEGTDINDVETWTTHVPEADCTVCETGGTCRIHDHWTWTMGGQTTYMPTFNKDKDSLAADINGTYHGTDDTDKIYYDDYVIYTTDDTTGGANVAEDEKEAYEGEIYSVVGTEYYDDDTDAEDNGGTRQVADVIHTAKSTATAEVILMADWDGTPGNFWVYDTDGWAYWANPIMPGEATGLLLDGIEMTKNPGERCYYAINVVGQFATVNDWEYFTEGGEPSDDALALLEAASQVVPTVTVTNVSGTTTVEQGSEYTFDANVYVNGVATYAATDFEWSVLDADMMVSETSTIADGVLSVGANETSATLTVVAKANDYFGAVGMSSVAVKKADSYVLSVENTTMSLGDEVSLNLVNTNTFATLSVSDMNGEGVENVTYTSSSESLTITGDQVALASGVDFNGLNAYTVTAEDASGNTLAQTTIYAFCSDYYEYIGAVQNTETGVTYYGFDYVPYEGEEKLGLYPTQVCVFRVGDPVENVYFYKETRNYAFTISESAETLDAYYAEDNASNRILVSENTWGS